MLELARAVRTGCAALLAAILILTAPLPSYAAIGFVRINLVKAGFIAGVAGGGIGAKVARLQNANGVVLELQGPEVGLEASASFSGMSISLR